MTISFDTIPNDLLIPFVGAEFNNSQAEQGASLLSYRCLLIGPKTSLGSASANTLHRVTSADQVGVLAGRNSVLFGKAQKWFQNNTFTEVYIGVLGDPSGAAAAGTITYSGTATAAGTVNLRCGDKLVQVAVASGDAASAVADATANEIAERIVPDGLPGSAADVGSVVTFTFAHLGTVGNGYPLSINWQDGEELPTGITAVIVQPTGGTGVPVLSTLIAAMGDQWFHVIDHCYTDATSLSAIEAELSRRFGGMTMIDGIAVANSIASLNTLATLGGTRNSPHSLIVAQGGPDAITPHWEFSAAVAAVTAKYGANDPARPFQTLELLGVKPTKISFTDTERQILLTNGVATTENAAGGSVRLNRLVTTYKTNAAGAPDGSYRDATTMLTLMYLRYDWNARLKRKYPRHKLGSDGGRYGAGQPVMTPLLAKAEAIAWFGEKEEQALVERKDLFKQNLLISRAQNRLNWLLPPNIIDQLIVRATRFDFGL